MTKIHLYTELQQVHFQLYTKWAHFILNIPHKTKKLNMIPGQKKKKSVYKTFSTCTSPTPFFPLQENYNHTSVPFSITWQSADIHWYIFSLIPAVPALYCVWFIVIIPLLPVSYSATTGLHSLILMLLNQKDVWEIQQITSFSFHQRAWLRWSLEKDTLAKSTLTGKSFIQAARDQLDPHWVLIGMCGSYTWSGFSLPLHVKGLTKTNKCNC